MLVYQGTGVTETPLTPITKPVGQLLISTNLALSAINTQRISIYVEKAGKNKDIANDVLLKDFLLISSQGEDAFQSDAVYPTIVLCELTKDGGFIKLNDNEVIKFKLSGLATTDVFRINGIEDPVGTNSVISQERKTMGADSVNQDFDVSGYDMVSMTRDSSIIEYAFTLSSGTVVKYLPYELDAISRSIDPIIGINANGTVTPQMTDRVLFPLKEVNFLNIRKSTGAVLNLTFRIDETNYNKKYA